MKTTANRILALFLLSLLMTSMLTACATFPMRSPDQAVRARAEALMKAKVNKDWSKAYTFFDPAYKQAVPESQYLGNISKMEFKNFTIDNVTVAPDGKHATAVVKSDVILNGLEFKGHKTTLDWVKEGGKWYLFIPPFESGK